MKTNSITIKQLTDWILITLRESAWAPLSILGIYLLGLASHIIIIYPILDNPIHLFGGIAITYFFRSAIRNSQEIFGETPLFIQILFAVTCTGTTIILWEFSEYMSDYLFKTQNVRSLSDTMKDMMDGLVGAFVLSCFYRR